MLNSYNENLVHIYEHALVSYWEESAMSDYGTSVTYTYGQVAEEIAKLHQLFLLLGIQKNDKVALMGKNCCNWAIVYLACLTYGAIVVPILHDFKPKDAAHILDHSESTLFFANDSLWNEIKKELESKVTNVFSLKDFSLLHSEYSRDENVWEKAKKAFTNFYPNGLSPKDVKYDMRLNSEIASINYTSGTTGFSKGVVTPCNALAGNIKLCLRTQLVFPKCRQLAFLPLAHAYGCAIDFLGCLAAGGHSYFMTKTPTPSILIQAFRTVKPTLIITVPLILEKIYKKQLAPRLSSFPYNMMFKTPYLKNYIRKKIKRKLTKIFGGCFEEIIVGGAPLNREVEKFLHKIHFPVSVGYGMTETAPLISFTKASSFKKFSCGQVIDGIMEMRIDQPDEEGIGEVQVRGENVMLGYYKNEQATQDAFTDDKWLRTGDLGYIDQDGFLFLKGRIKTILLGANGQNIYPEAIEAALNNFPFVSESLIIQRKEQLIALVYPDYSKLDSHNISHNQIDKILEQYRNQLNAGLANYEKISKIKIFPHEFEKTPKKSIKRNLYSSLFEEN